jgi:TolB protein
MNLIVRMVILALGLLCSTSLWAQEEGDRVPSTESTAPDIESQAAVPEIRIEDFLSMRVPIAVPDTFANSPDPGGVRDLIAGTIRTCLGIAGYFNVHTPENFFFDASAEGMHASTINFQNYVLVGSQGLIKTAFATAANGVGLDFRLYNVDTGEQLDVGYPATVVVPQSDVQREVYRFVNLVIQYYTGTLGIFGSRIVFTAPDGRGVRQIFTIGMDGSGLGSVTSGSLNVSPSWGPGGSIFFTSYRSGNTDLYLGNDSWSTRPGMNMNAALSPSGGEVAAVLSMSGNTDIYILNTSGEILRRCTETGAEDLSPTWSPDGSQIAFVSDRSGGPQVFVMNADCSGQRRISFAGNYNTDPDWSPGGDLIAFTGRTSGGRYDIFTINPASSQMMRVTQDQGDNEHPSFSPDGRYLVFASTRDGGGGQLYISTVDGLSQVRITTSGGDARTPEWE